VLRRGDERYHSATCRVAGSTQITLLHNNFSAALMICVLQHYFNQYLIDSDAM